MSNYEKFDYLYEDYKNREDFINAMFDYAATYVIEGCPAEVQKAVFHFDAEKDDELRLRKVIQTAIEHSGDDLHNFYVTRLEKYLTSPPDIFVKGQTAYSMAMRDTILEIDMERERDEHILEMGDEDMER